MVEEPEAETEASPAVDEGKAPGPPPDADAPVDAAGTAIVAGAEDSAGVPLPSGDTAPGSAIKEAKADGGDVEMKDAVVDAGDEDKAQKPDGANKVEMTNRITTRDLLHPDMGCMCTVIPVRRVPV